MSKIKIIFFDIDGTLLNIGKKDMTSNTKKALNLLKQNNIKICIATGRPMTSIPVFEEITFDGTLAFNGSFCVVDNEIVIKRPIPNKDIYKILENANKIGRAISIATTDKIVANGSDRDLEDYFAIAHQKVVVSERFEQEIDKDIYQIMLGCDFEERKYILEGVENAKLAAWWDRAVDIIPNESGKGRAIKEILEYYNFSKEEAMAFGDGANDIDMLLAVGTGVAMGNAKENVKEIASDICGDVVNDGIFYYLKEHGIIDE